SFTCKSQNQCLQCSLWCRRTPTAAVAGDTPLVRTYCAWKGNNEFCLRGRLIFGPDGKSIFLTIFLIVAPVAVFSAFVARNLLDDFPHHWGYSILIVVILHSVYGRRVGIGRKRNGRPEEGANLK
ncbi:probable protein S-acyltransferase 5, partial [Glycine soja]|uniref:probable protein S-acyltransferase 5 n=1 Tax=Glycine soja TaxID=3848 RepID=UPI00103A485E